EGRVAKAGVADFHHVADAAAVALPRQGGQESLEIGGLELLERGELPEQGTEAVAQLEDARGQEAVDRFARFRQHLALGHEARALHREHETVRYLARPFAEGRRRLGAVKRPVDLNGGKVRGRVGQLLRVGQAFRIKNAAPGLERPAPDAYIDASS